MFSSGISTVICGFKRGFICIAYVQNHINQKHSVVPHAVIMTVDLWPFLVARLKSTAITPRPRNTPVVTPSSFHWIFMVCGTRVSLAIVMVSLYFLKNSHRSSSITHLYLLVYELRNITYLDHFFVQLPHKNLTQDQQSNNINDDNPKRNNELLLRKGTIIIC